MNSQDTNKTSEQLQREVHGQIDKIGTNIETIRNRMSPGNLLDDAIFYPHGQSLSATYNHMRNNPMGSMFLSLGTLLLMEDQNHVSYEDRFKASAGDAYEKGRVQYHETKERFSEKSSHWSERAKSAAREAKEKIQSKTQQWRAKGEAMEDRIESQGEGFIERARRLKDKSVEKINKARGQAVHGVEGGIERARESWQTRTPLGEAMHPYAIASIGLGLGASLGASFPLPKVEQRLQAPEYRDRIKRLSADFDDAIREAGDRIKNHLIDELKQFNFH